MGFSCSEVRTGCRELTTLSFRARKHQDETHLRHGTGVRGSPSPSRLQGGDTTVASVLLLEHSPYCRSTHRNPPSPSSPPRGPQHGHKDSGFLLLNSSVSTKRDCDIQWHVDAVQSMWRFSQETLRSEPLSNPSHTGWCPRKSTSRSEFPISFIVFSKTLLIDSSGLYLCGRCNNNVFPPGSMKWGSCKNVCGAGTEATSNTIRSFLLSTAWPPDTARP